MDETCERCGRTFTSTGRKRVRQYCSEACRVALCRGSGQVPQARKASTSAAHKKRGRKKLPRGNCLTCGASLEGKAPGNKYCSKKCADIGHTTHKVYLCKRCGKEFSPKAAGRTTFCSRECAFAYRRENAKPKSEKPEAPKHYCLFCGSEVSQWAKVCDAPDCRQRLKRGYYRRKKPEAEVTSPLVCAECGREFLPEYGNKHRRFCSDACMYKGGRRTAKQVRRARKKAVPSESIRVRDVYERDGWRCGICGKKVDPSLKSPHPMSVSLDHIVPIACGGPHTMGNVQCAHRSCNSRKGATGAGQLRMMGCFT